MILGSYFATPSPKLYPDEYLKFVELYWTCSITSVVMWGIGFLLLARHVLAMYERKTTNDNTLESIATISPIKELKRFKTHVGLWLLISLVLFLVPWFMMDIKAGGDNIKYPVQLWFALLSDPSNIGEVISRIFHFSLLFAVPALAIGWVVQCFIIMIRGSVKEKK